MNKTILIFFAGFLSCAVIFLSLNFFSQISPFLTGYATLNSAPSGKITEDSILLFDDEIILKIANTTISAYENTGSMKPVFDYTSHGIRIKPSSPDDISIGDIVSFRKGGELIVHRVIEKEVDENGIYFVTKGDGNFFSDGKVRYEDIEYITIGILW